MSDHRRHKRDHIRHESDHARTTKLKAVELWNAIAEYEQGGGSREAAASPHVQTLTRDLLKLAGTWTFTRVPELLWSAVVGRLSKEITRRHTVYWWCCLEVARQLLWMMDVDYMIHGLPVIDVGPEGKYGRRATTIKTGDETRECSIQGMTALRLGELKDKGQCEFDSRAQLKRFIDDLPELHLHLETVPPAKRIVRRLSVDARARITIV